jgi:hypothetical protein
VAWADLASSDPELAEAGAARPSRGFAFLATTRRDGSPRIHPVSPGTRRRTGTCSSSSALKRAMLTIYEADPPVRRRWRRRVRDHPVD